MTSDLPGPEAPATDHATPADAAETVDAADSVEVTDSSAAEDAPPVTGHEAIDAALAAVTLGPDVHTHADELGAAVEAIQRALNPPSQQPLPGR